MYVATCLLASVSSVSSLAVKYRNSLHVGLPMCMMKCILLTAHYSDPYHKNLDVMEAVQYPQLPPGYNPARVISSTDHSQNQFTNAVAIYTNNT